LIATPFRRMPTSIALLGATLVLIASACSSPSPSASKPAANTAGSAASTSGGDAQKGRTLMIEKGCGACHTARGVPEATGSIGPNLTGIASKPRIADTLDNTPENMKRWITNPSAAKPGTMMPPLGLSDTESSDLVAFLETLK
jgi:cytochrome c2